MLHRAYNLKHSVLSFCVLFNTLQHFTNKWTSAVETSWLAGSMGLMAVSFEICFFFLFWDSSCITAEIIQMFFKNVCIHVCMNLCMHAFMHIFISTQNLLSQRELGIEHDTTFHLLLLISFFCSGIVLFINYITSRDKILCSLVCKSGQII